MSNIEDHVRDRDIAIIGMAGRFPKAMNLDTFWQNLQQGVEGMTVLSDEELLAAGNPHADINDPQYVKASMELDGVELFDADFFGYTPREAEIMDPQQRLFLEYAWEALEHAGYNPYVYDGLIGVYAGVAWNTYLLSNLTQRRDLFGAADIFQVFITSDKDFMPTRVSYKLNLKGPSIIIQTSCSTSLVALHTACLNLLAYECDMALVGGVTVKVPQKSGYLYQEGGLASPDGHCRAFDAKGRGTIFGSGIGMVVLKRLSEALDDGDTIHAVIKGSAINNDGSLKVSYTAPSVEGQAEVIAAAQSVAEVDIETIQYVEAHGTGTELGDPIEVAALTKVFRESTDKKQFCALGSVKSNVGHLDAAAGIAGLLKTVLSLKHRQLPPSLHFEEPNPKIDFDNSPFYVNAALSEWNTNGAPRRAGISSFGVGGTNAHVIVEEAPTRTPTTLSRPWQVLLLSARSDAALAQATTNLAHHFEQHPEESLADAAYTLATGRVVFRHRRAVICQNTVDALSALQNLDTSYVISGVDTQEPRHQPIVFMFPGQGAQYAGMAADLYNTEIGFRDLFDYCATFLVPYLDMDLRTYVFGDEQNSEVSITDTLLAQPALFVIEYALAQWWMSWGIQPHAIIGHSIGEYVAACLAGVFTLEDALKLVAARARLMQQLPRGAMLAVGLAESDIQPLLIEGLSLAAINEPTRCVVAGTVEAINQLEVALAEQQINTQRLHTSHAFHSAMMDPIIDAFAQEVRACKLQKPQLRYISNLTGTWITDENAVDPHYWTQHLRQTVRFADGLTEITKDQYHILLEVGPGRSLGSFARKQSGQSLVLGSLRHPNDTISDVAFLLHTLSQLWVAGVPLVWTDRYRDERRQRIPLPTYPFERQRYWIDPNIHQQVYQHQPERVSKHNESEGWFYVPSWKRSTVQSTSTEPYQRWLIWCDSEGFGTRLAQRLTTIGHEVIVVFAGDHFEANSNMRYTVNPFQRVDYTTLFNDLSARGKLPDQVIHLWSVSSTSFDVLDSTRFDEIQSRGSISVLSLAQAITEYQHDSSIRMTILSTHLHRIAGESVLDPAKAPLLGICTVIPQEYPQINCQSVDVVLPPPESRMESRLIDLLVTDLQAPSNDRILAYRDQQRWVQSVEPYHLQKAPSPATILRQQGVYIITGVCSVIGLTLATYLAQTWQAHLILIDDFTDATISSDTDSTTSYRSQLHELEAYGAQIFVADTNLTDKDQLGELVSQAISQFGSIDGVIHAATCPESQVFCPINATNASIWQRHIEPKVHGLLVLQQVLNNQNPRFFLLVSSLATMLGGLGYAAYSAANAFLDAFAQQQNLLDRAVWMSVNWDAWRPEHSEHEFTLPNELNQFALTTTEGVETFRRIMDNSQEPRIMVSTGNLLTRLEQWVHHPTIHRLNEIPLSEADNPLYPRPKLVTPYVAPTTDMEQTIATIWQRMLGIESIGIHDNFFDLGGDSFIAIQLASRLKQALKIDIAVISLYECRTISNLSKSIIQEQESAHHQNQQLAERKAKVAQRKAYHRKKRAGQVHEKQN
ncbi:MAG: SDR family NAD(P)-dependent oxidoreductase [Chloroflexota bacterium]